MLTVAYGGYGWWVGNIQMLTEAFTMVEVGVFGLTLTKDKNNFYTV